VTSDPILRGKEEPLPSPSERPALGLRERKKAKTRAAIQRHALRLFREQGYDATTTSQIAAAAEVSDSTFFRYFPTKEAVVAWDDFDPRMIEIFRTQPADASTLQALRTALRDVLAQLSTDEQAAVRERMSLMLSVAPLRALLLDQIDGPMRLMATAVADRTGRDTDDPAVRALVGAVIGVGLSAMFAAADDPSSDLVALLDEAMAHLEAGLAL
jgi:AcrR family transcriptional regulator